MQLTVCNCFNISFTVMQEEKRPLKKISRAFSILNSANFLFQYCAYFYFRIWRMQFILIKVKISINYSCHIKAESEYQKYRKLAFKPVFNYKITFRHCVHNCYFVVKKMVLKAIINSFFWYKKKHIFIARILVYIYTKKI